MWLEHRAQQRLRFASTRRSAQHGDEAQPLRLRGGAALAAFACCALPVLLGFVLPVLVLLRLLWQEAQASETGLLGGLPWSRFGPWAWTSFKLAGMAALLATGLALLLGFSLRLPVGARTGRRGARRRCGGAARGARIVGLGYAVPGAVIAVGILLPVAWLQRTGRRRGRPRW